MGWGLCCSWAKVDGRRCAAVQSSCLHGVMSGAGLSGGDETGYSERQRAIEGRSAIFYCDFKAFRVLSAFKAGAELDAFLLLRNSLTLRPM